MKTVIICGIPHVIEELLVIDQDGLLQEPCLSCDKAYVEDIWYSWCCDEKECPYKAESEGEE